MNNPVANPDPDDFEPDGTPINKRLTAILGIAFDNHNCLYVLENTVGQPGPTPGFGDVIRLDPSGKREVITSGLNLPTAMTKKFKAIFRTNEEDSISILLALKKVYRITIFPSFSIQVNQPYIVSSNGLYIKLNAEYFIPVAQKIRPFPEIIIGNNYTAFKPAVKEIDKVVESGMSDGKHGFVFIMPSTLKIQIGFKEAMVNRQSR